MVYGREIDGNKVTFGTTGYTLNNVFVLYDRATGSVWYPTSNEYLQATSGVRRGARLKFLERPEPVPLADWRRANPGTNVLLPP